MIKWLLPLAVLGVAGVGAAMAASATHTASGTVKAADRSPYGMVLVSASGRTLYRYTKDSKHVNRCTSDSKCNPFWPPLLVKATAKPTAGLGVNAKLLGTIKAAHDMRQVTYAGYPLYFFAGDTAAGQTKGQGFQKQWYVVNTKGAFVKHALAGGSTSTKSTSTSSGAGWG
jgi:predicted lipoprotein with Yx(FWY)xxD motif